MFSETIQTPRPKPAQIFLGLVGLLCLTAILTWSISKVIALTGWGALDSLPVVILGVLAYVLYQRYSISYRYTLMEDNLILEQMVGKLPKMQFSVRLSAVRRLEANGKPEPGIPVERLMPRGHPADVFLLVDDAEGRKRQFRFQPSGALISRLTRELKAVRDLPEPGAPENAGAAAETDR
ncbi:MAG TPA: hypothetical protein PKE04_17115 [Clostridia bacterium]|nr:hypothetical protein [Clostridia bacterium]